MFTVLNLLLCTSCDPCAMNGHCRRGVVPVPAPKGAPTPAQGPRGAPAAAPTETEVHTSLLHSSGPTDLCSAPLVGMLGHTSPLRGAPSCARPWGHAAKRRRPMNCPRSCRAGSARVVPMHVDGASFLGRLLTAWRRVASQSACQCMLTGPGAFLAEKVKSLACAWQDRIGKRRPQPRYTWHAYEAWIPPHCLNVHVPCTYEL
jgi:hypothetical protein